MNTTLIIGLGNPGLKYRKTKHNVGFILIDELAKELKGKFKKKKDLKAEIAELNINRQKIILAKAITYMNNSGEAVRLLVNKYKIENIIVIFDDVSMKFGKTRIREQGSSGGHNGIKSIITHFGSDKFTRFKFGIGEAPEEMKLENWVLSKFSKEEMKEINKSKTEIAKQIMTLL